MNWYELWSSIELNYRYYIEQAPRLNLGEAKTREYIAFCESRMKRARSKRLRISEF